MDIALQLAKELQIKKEQVEVTVKLIDEGNTIPFIARYRKDVTGNLNDEVLRNLNERLTYLRNLCDKQEQVISSIEEQGKMTEELRKQILQNSFLRRRQQNLWKRQLKDIYLKKRMLQLWKKQLREQEILLRR